MLTTRQVISDSWHTWNSVWSKKKKNPSLKFTSCAYPYLSQQLFLSSDCIKQEMTHQEMVSMAFDIVQICKTKMEGNSCSQSRCDTRTRKEVLQHWATGREGTDTEKGRNCDSETHVLFSHKFLVFPDILHMLVWKFLSLAWWYTLAGNAGLWTALRLGFTFISALHKMERMMSGASTVIGLFVATCRAWGRQDCPLYWVRELSKTFLLWIQELTLPRAHITPYKRWQLEDEAKASFPGSPTHLSIFPSRSVAESSQP